MDTEYIEIENNYTNGKQLATAGNILNTLRHYNEKLNKYIDNYDLDLNGNTYNSKSFSNTELKSKPIKARVYKSETELKDTLDFNLQINHSNGELSFKNIEGEEHELSNTHIFTEKQLFYLLKDIDESIFSYVDNQAKLLDMYIVEEETQIKVIVNNPSSNSNIIYFYPYYNGLKHTETRDLEISDRLGVLCINKDSIKVFNDNSSQTNVPISITFNENGVEKITKTCTLNNVSNQMLVTGVSLNGETLSLNFSDFAIEKNFLDKKFNLEYNIVKKGETETFLYDSIIFKGNKIIDPKEDNNLELDFHNLSTNEDIEFNIECYVDNVLENNIEYIYKKDEYEEIPYDGENEIEIENGKILLIKNGDTTLLNIGITADYTYYGGPINITVYKNKRKPQDKYVLIEGNITQLNKNTEETTVLPIGKYNNPDGPDDLKIEFTGENEITVDITPPTIGMIDRFW